jgi:dihydrodipicolinate synthase/N-acetylneuraminate lyase
MDRNDVAWKGYWPACPTPFTDDDKIDTASLRALVEWFVSQDFHGIFVNGTTGEWFSQTEQERKLVAETVLDQVAGRIPVVVGVSSFTAIAAAALGHHAVEHGASGIGSTLPPYAKTLPNESIAYYEDLSSLVGAPMMIYNWPHGTNVDIDSQLALRLCDIENVVAFKDSTPNVDQFWTTTETIIDKVRIFGNFMTQAGLDFISRVGGDGMIGGGSVFGRPDSEFWQDVWTGNDNRAREHAIATEKLFDALWAPGGWRGHYGAYQSQLKAIMTMRGIPGGGPVRRPRLPITDPKSLDAIRTALIQAGLSVVPK